jgi:AcrR family transcriptional regulator
MAVATATTGQMRRSARERLLAAADELFYAEGIQSVGIDRIIERAGVAKASLYHCFSSKEELVGAYLEGRRNRVTSRLMKAVEATDDPRSKIIAMFTAQEDMCSAPGYRGCAFVAASTEAPEGGVVQKATADFRRWIRATFIALAREAGAPDPDRLGLQLQLIYDGASLSVRLDGHAPAVSAAARSAVELLLDSSLRGTSSEVAGVRKQPPATNRSGR